MARIREAFIFGKMVLWKVTIGKTGGSCKAALVVIKPLGDSAWLVEFPGLSGEAALARVLGWMNALAVNPPEGVLDVVPSFASLAVHFDEVDGLEIVEWLQSVRVNDAMPEGEEWQIPVCYGGESGPDLAEVATRLGLSEAEVILRHSSASYRVAVVGFSPGFPYLLGLPESLYLPRHRTPRKVVPAGSVAVAGGQAGIYPFASPGGWQILGRTGLKLFDPAGHPSALLKTGDRVRFVPVDHIDVRESAPVAPTVPGNPSIHVISPGSLTTVQDLGRPGHGAAGVSPGGAMDRHALQVANLMVGNAPDAPALEICVSGPILEFSTDTVIATVGAVGKSRQVSAGERVDFSKPAAGVRSYLAVAGGLKISRMLGSAATDVRAGFGGYLGRPLEAGDLLETGEPGSIPRCGNWFVGRPDPRAEIELRFLAGVQSNGFSEKAHWRFRNEIYHLTPDADRMGARLDGPSLDLVTACEMTSQPVACGSVQVPPDGMPIVLLAERQTIGGYPQIGHVISADFPKLARAWPGTRVRFREVSWEDARRIQKLEKQNLIRLQVGLKLLV